MYEAASELLLKEKIKNYLMLKTSGQFQFL